MEEVLAKFLGFEYVFWQHLANYILPVNKQALFRTEGGGGKERERVGGVQPRRDDLSRYRLRQANCRANLSSLLPLGQVGTKKSLADSES